MPSSFVGYVNIATLAHCDAVGRGHPLHQPPIRVVAHRFADLLLRESGGLCEVRGAMTGLPESGPHISRIERSRPTRLSAARAPKVCHGVGATATVANRKNSLKWRAYCYMGKAIFGSAEITMSYGNSATGSPQFLFGFSLAAARSDRARASNRRRASVCLRKCEAGHNA